MEAAKLEVICHALAGSYDMSQEMSQCHAQPGEAEDRSSKINAAAQMECRIYIGKAIREKKYRAICKEESRYQKIR